MITWQAVPSLVAQRYKVGRALQSCVAVHDCTAVWQPTTATVFVKLADDELVPPRFPSFFQVVQGLPESIDGSYVLLKTANDPLKPAADALGKIPLSSLSAPHKAVGGMFGGPSALTNSLVSGAIGAGGGYLAGSLMSNLLPEEYVKRKNVSRYLALLGGLGGAALHLPELAGNLRANKQVTGDSHIIQSFAAPHARQPFAKAGSSNAAWDMPIRTDSFNRALWADSTTNQGFTPPPVAAAASGLVTGVQQMYGGSNILTPRHMLNGLIAAGVDMTTAHIAGSTLGALGLITPKAQQAIQATGLWGGLIRGVTSSVLGL